MLRNIQIKIIAIFLVIGIFIIGAMGYINYASLERVQSNLIDYDEMLKTYQEQSKIITICTISVFSLICITVRNICN